MLTTTLLLSTPRTLILTNMLPAFARLSGSRTLSAQPKPGFHTYLKAKVRNCFCPQKVGIHCWTQSVQGAVATWSNDKSQKSLGNNRSDALMTGPGRYCSLY